MRLFLCFSLSVFLFSCSSMKGHYSQIEEEVEHNLAELSQEFFSSEDLKTFKSIEIQPEPLLEENIILQKEAEELAKQDEHQIQSDDFLSEVFLGTFSTFSGSEADLGIKNNKSSSRIERDLAKKTNLGSEIASSLDEDSRFYFEPKAVRLEKSQKSMHDLFQVLNELKEEKKNVSKKNTALLKGFKWVKKDGKVKFILQSDQRLKYKTVFNDESDEIFIDIDKINLSKSLREQISKNSDIQIYEIPSRHWVRVIISKEISERDSF